MFSLNFNVVFVRVTIHSSLVTVIEKLSKSVDQDFGTLLTDQLKVFDCLSHELLNDELHAYGFDHLRHIQLIDNKK